MLSSPNGIYDLDVAEQAPSEGRWRLLYTVKGFGHVLLDTQSELPRMLPLIILKMPLLAPKKHLDAEKFNLQHPDPTGITEVADKLRWYRYQKALLQSDVAAYLGIERSTYHHYESGSKEYYPLAHMEKLATLYDIPVENLLDEYNLFLYHGQGTQVRAIRTEQGLTQKAFADKLGVRLCALKRWETDKATMQKSTWHRHFQISTKNPHTGF